MKSKYYASYEPFVLYFKKPAGTSRGFLNVKKSWLLKIKDIDQNIEGIGECSIIPGLSMDDESKIENVLDDLSHYINENENFAVPVEIMQNFPAIKFAFESAILDLNDGGRNILFDNAFSRG